MSGKPRDISTYVIPERNFVEQLSVLFVDSIILDLKFNVEDVHVNLLQALGYTLPEIRGKSVNAIAGNDDLAFHLKRLLSRGSFFEERFTFYSKGKEAIEVAISGFYLGLITQVNGLIVLQIRSAAMGRFRDYKSELDQFIYGAAHNLRGPIATMKGLLNLLKIEQYKREDFSKIIDLLNVQCAALDERVFKLSYLSDVSKQVKCIHYKLDFNAIETSLRDVIEKNGLIESIDFDYHAPTEVISGYNEVGIELLLMHALLFTLTLKMKQMPPGISIRITYNSKSLFVNFKITGFDIDEMSRLGLAQNGFLYTDLIAYPQLLNFYAAEKIARELGAAIKINFNAGDKHKMGISIPKASLPTPLVSQ